MTERILFVDDEPPVLDGYKRTLHRDFDVDTAVGGEQGLNSIFERGPYPVVISDMRMPGMNGAQFLAQVRQRAPDTVRMLPFTRSMTEISSVFLLSRAIGKI